MSGDAVFIIVSYVLIFAFTWYMISTSVKRNRFMRKLMQQLKDAENAEKKDESHPPEE